MHRVTDPGAPDRPVGPPAPIPGFVHRARLGALVEAGTAAGGVTTLCAPAGAGKTVLLADWARTGPVATAWVSVVAADDEPGRLWAAIAGAVAQVAPDQADTLGRSVLDPATAHFPTALLSVLDTLPGALRLVLDDVGRIVEPVVLEGLETLVRYRPTGLRLVLSGRTSPALPWPRLRLRGDVVDLDGDELAFTLEEAATLVARRGIRMSPAQLRRSHAMTGGWAAALRLVAGSTSGRGEPAGPPEPSLAAYLDEVLGGLTDDDRALLRDVSVCDAITPALAAAVSGRDDAGATLERLARSIPLVSADPVRGQLTILAPVRTSLSDGLGHRRPELHRRAAAWFAANDRAAEAVDHACAAGDGGLVADLVRTWAVPLLLNGDHDALRRACATLPPAAIAADHTLRLVAPALDAVAGGGRDGDGREETGPEAAAELRALRAVADVLTARDGADEPGDERPGRASPASARALTCRDRRRDPAPRARRSPGRRRAPDLGVGAGPGSRAPPSRDAVRLPARRRARRRRRGGRDGVRRRGRRRDRRGPRLAAVRLGGLGSRGARPRVAAAGAARRRPPTRGARPRRS